MGQFDPVFFANTNVAFLLVVLGILAVYWELHAPGMVVPGVVGVCAFFVGVWFLSQDHPTWYGMLLLLVALILLVVELKFYTHMVSGLAGSAALAAGALLLIPAPHSIAPWVAVPLSLALGVITVFLGTLAMRAHHNKVAVGEKAMIGELGTARTKIDPTGTVFVRGEYWQAHSAQPIEAGEPITVVHVDGLTVDVERVA